MDFVMCESVVRVNVPSRERLLWEIDRRLASGEGFSVATLNLDHLVKLQDDAAFRRAYARQDFVTADGNPVVWLAHLAGRSLDLLPGADLVKPVAQLLAERGLPVGFLGSTAPALELAARSLAEEVPGLDVRERIAPAMGFDPEGPEAVAALDRMAAAGVRVVMLALGAPKQERLAALARERHPGMGFLCIGAGLDFWAGTQHRAPAWLRGLAMEWLWRAALSPRRLGMRYARCAMILPSLAARAALDRLAGSPGGTPSSRPPAAL